MHDYKGQQNFKQSSHKKIRTKRQAAMSLSQKKTTRIRSVTSPAKKSPMRSKKQKQWSEQSMVAVIKAVQEGLPIYTSAKEHDVPRTMLQDRILGKGRILEETLT